MDFSMKKVDKDPETKRKLISQCKDADGGESFAVALNLATRVLNSLTYLQATCCLHGHNLTLKNPITLLMGNGGLNIRSMLQLIFTAYNFQFGGGGG